MTKFRIEYFDPKQEIEITVEKEFFDSADCPAAMWAEDWAYTAADKHYHKVTEVIEPFKWC